MYRLELVEKVRHILAVREAFASPTDHASALSKLTLSSSRMNLSTLTTSPSSPSSSATADFCDSLDERQKELCAKVLALLQSCFKVQSSGSEAVGHHSAPPSGGPSRAERGGSPGSSPELLSPDKPKLADVWSKRQSPNTVAEAVQKPSSEKLKKIVLVPEIEEVCLSQGVSKKGSICLMSETRKWTKHWLLIRRPYMFVYKNDKEPIEEAVINLTEAEVEYCTHDEDSSSSAAEVFAVAYRSREYWFKASSAKEAGEWLYAIKPLFAGEIKSKLSRRRKESLVSAT